MDTSRSVPPPIPAVAAAVPQQPLPSAPSGLNALIPSKNTSALVGYYLGVFSIIPGMGVLLSIPAIVLGIMGLRRVSRRPSVKGKVHAWVAIILGALQPVGIAAWIAVAALA
jgi:hypothetical protein